jgi:uncharacterized protein (TIGR00159 family)
MIESFRRWIGPLAETVRFADLLDVALVGAFLFALLTWLQQDARSGTSRRFGAALALFAAVHLLTNAFSMYLIRQLLEVLVIVFLVAMVVVFQSEIRRLLDRIGSWSFSQPSTPSRSDELIDDLTESAAELAGNHTGALIALRGSENWDSQLQGGVPLEGRVSLPLLRSIFHEKTPGHDGALLLENGRITKFGVHLPLASQIPPSSEYGGTRHAAALGLAEQTDALVIVVSEEQGAVSVAERGDIAKMETPSDLKSRLRRFWKTHYERDETQRSRWWSQRTVRTAVVALVLACLSWFAFAYRPATTYRPFIVPIEFRNKGKQWSIEGPNVTEARVSLSGSERALRALDPAGLIASFNLDQLHPGVNEFILTEENLDLPSGVNLDQAEPRTIEVVAHRLQAKRLAVHVPTAGAPPDSLRLVGLSPDPDSVEVLVLGGDHAPSRISTEKLDLSGVRSSSTSTLKLVPPDDMRLPESTPGEVKVQVRVQRKKPQQKAPTP